MTAQVGTGGAYVGWICAPGGSGRARARCVRWPGRSRDRGPLDRAAGRRRGSAVLARSARRGGRAPDRVPAHLLFALALDALAIASQTTVGRLLGAGDVAGARAAARPDDVRAVAARRGVRASSCSRSATSIPRAFTTTRRWIERAHEIWSLFAPMMPFNGAVFALDGILIGAGDTRFLALGMLAAPAVFVPLAIVAVSPDWGILGVWFGLAGLIAVRLLTCALRFSGRRWGAPAPPPADKGYHRARLHMTRRLLLLISFLVARSARPGRPRPGAAGGRRSARCRPPSPAPTEPLRAGRDRRRRKKNEARRHPAATNRRRR